MPYLILDKHFAGYRIVRLTGDVTIGRGSENDIVLNDSDDREISRRHALIRRRGNSYCLYDESSNGTFVEEQKIKNLGLRNGTRFRIADYNFTFVSDEATGGNLRSRGFSREAADSPLEALGEEETVFASSQPERKGERHPFLHRLREWGIVATSTAMQALFTDLAEIAKVNVPVLILGEPGTGKDKVAQALHGFSGADGNFVALNCAAIPEGIFESEMFGSVKGAFHNAVDKPGKLELAQNGTIFFDEIGEMSPVIQPKLLRFLDDKKIVRLGDTRIRTVDVRVIAATNRDVGAMLAEKNFREDLYQRLACVTLKIPPLRERKEDVLPMAAHFLKKFAAEHDLPVCRLAEDSREMLVNHDWPGNVRELANVLFAAAIRCRTGVLQPALLKAASPAMGERGGSGPAASAFPLLRDTEKSSIEEALARAGGNKVRAAQLLGISRDTLYKKLKKYCLGP